VGGCVREHLIREPIPRPIAAAKKKVLSIPTCSTRPFSNELERMRGQILAKNAGPFGAEAYPGRYRFRLG